MRGLATKLFSVITPIFIGFHLRLSAVKNPQVFNLYRFHFGIG